VFDRALAEGYFHRSRQPVFPSKLQSVLHRLRLTTARTLKIADLAALEALGSAPKAMRPSLMPAVSKLAMPPSFWALVAFWPPAHAGRAKFWGCASTVCSRMTLR
jgi:hypothetical protein